MTTPDPEQDIGNLHFKVLPHMGLSSHPQPLSLRVHITERQTDRPVWVRCAPLALTWFKPGSQGPVPVKLDRLWRGLPDHPSHCLQSAPKVFTQGVIRDCPRVWCVHAHAPKAQPSQQLGVAGKGGCEAGGAPGPIPLRQNQVLLPLAPPGPRSCPSYHCVQPPAVLLGSHPQPSFTVA